MAHNVIELNEQNFKKEVLESNIPVIVDFWATWCMPCKMIAPAVEEIAKDYKGKLKVGKVNVDDNTSIATQYGIMSIPTLLFFKNGEVLDNLVGAVSKQDIEDKISEIV